MKIICVDDEMSILHNFLNDIIDKNEVDCKFFKDMPEKIEAYVKENDVSAAFLDVNMPNINGLELAENLIAINHNIKIVFMTGLNITENDLEKSVRANTLGFLYKPYDVDVLSHYLTVIGNKPRRMRVVTFDSFDCFLSGRIVKFSSKKSKELFALLIAYNGKSLDMTDAISQLWPDMDTTKSKALYRDAVWRLRKTFNALNFNCVDFERAHLYLDKTNIDCDYWGYTEGSNNDYRGEFMKNYDWSVPYLNILDKIRLSRQ